MAKLEELRVLEPDKSRVVEEHRGRPTTNIRVEGRVQSCPR